MKNKHLAQRILALLFVLCFCIGMVPLTVSAATTTPYYKIYGTNYNVFKDHEAEAGPPDCYDIYLYGSSTSGSGTIYDNAVLNWDHYTFYLDAHSIDFGIWFRLYKDGEDYVFDYLTDKDGSDRVLFSDSLPDGNYSMHYLGHYETHFLFIYTAHEYDYAFNFIADRTAPTISGASTSVKYTNSGFTVSASDATSGIKTFWYAEPGDQYFKAASSNSVTIPAGSTKGYYHFFATDNAGNSSETYYVYYDNTKPTGNITNTSGTVLTGSYTTNSFKYSASDNDSGISYRQYKTPSSSSWTTYSGSIIYSSAADGYYQFRAVDRSGNVSAVKGITLDATAPTGTLYGGTTVVASGGSIIADYIKYVPTDATSGVHYSYVKKPGATSYSSYTSGTQLTEKGSYSFYSVDYAGNTSQTYTATLKAAAPVVTPTYTVSFNANSGSNAPASQVKTKDIALTLTTAQPTRTGYDFLGWNTNQNATSPTYYSGGSYTANSSATLYAVWRVKTYSVTYNANNGSGAPSGQTKNYGTTLTLSSVKPTRTGYTFLGWSTSSTASSPSYYAGGSFSGNYSLNLYAVWQRNPYTYTVSYNANGGNGAPSAQTKTENVTLYLSGAAPTKNHYSFMGWSTSATSQVVTYTPGDAYTANSSIALYAVWQYAPEAYIVRYNANGGSGTPSAQTKTEGVALTLSSVKPTRERYTFLGWGTDSSATSASYAAGASFTTDANTTLYAVWQKDNYEFSISNLSVEESSIFRYGTATVKVRTDSWDRVNAYSDIPVQLYYDGKLIGTQYVDFAAYGVANVTFRVNVGDTEGAHSLVARINWNERNEETDSTNNSVSGSLTVKGYDYEMSAHSVAVTDDYCAGTTVISSFTIDNDSDFDITPGADNSAVFTAYYYNGSQKVVINTQTWKQIVIPSKGSNLVYFKWDVPSGIAGKVVYCECTVNGDNHLSENNRTNNTATFSKTIASVTTSQTTSTRYESNTPATYSPVNAPAEKTGTASWTMWEYENGAFVLKTYGIRVSSDTPEASPANSCQTAAYINGVWNMKSGYGYSLEYIPSLIRQNGCTMPDNNAYTEAQSAYAFFPEFMYQSASGKYRTLEKASGVFRFIQNEDADENDRVHFIPLWFNNGSYKVSVTVTQIWTPVGMITATRNANTLNINGTVYDDFYQG